MPVDLGWHYPAGLENHPDAPWNRPEREPEDDGPDDFHGNDDDL